MWFILWEVQQRASSQGTHVSTLVPFPQPPGWPPPPARWLQHIQAQCNTAPRDGKKCTIFWCQNLDGFCLQNPWASCRCLTQVHLQIQPSPGQAGVACFPDPGDLKAEGLQDGGSCWEREGMQRPGRQSASPHRCLTRTNVRLWIAGGSKKVPPFFK